ncbi:hypothetical protein PHYBOEH_004500 [Phytophthora boehmeriae]|uniref:Crinkler (CRN) family protein n=1 Tax=Phytophthora boehmeriae TaxID=109152 RepID=A0A8T1WN97_9STRA|nr:hypothetical protein PHYBOEH_004500 [Phytophthora boehmeriae]
MSEAVKCWMENSSIELRDLLDKAFARVSLVMHEGKGFMRTHDGREAQKMAISFTNVPENNVGEREPKTRRVEVEATGMHLHFANLEDKELTDVGLATSTADREYLWLNDIPWTPKCRFSDIEEDLLLYLAILGGKTCSSYYVHPEKVYSAKYIFSEELALHAQESSNSVPCDPKKHENMVTHAIFSSSRRNGVGGIPFLDFLTGLFGEFQSEDWVDMTLYETGKPIDARSLFQGYGGSITELLDRKVPFLAPSNAKWPQFILDTNTQHLGCKFGRLVRFANASRRDIIIQDVSNNNEKAMFHCECKYLDRTLHVGAMSGAIVGLDDAWEGEWTFALVFCAHLTGSRSEWTETEVGCVKINCEGSSAVVEWVFTPDAKYRKKLIMVVETGLIGETEVGERMSDV